MFAVDTNRKGAIAEMKIATAATELGVPVLRPMTEHGRYDLAFELGGCILRVQCKWGALDRAGRRGKRTGARPRDACRTDTSTPATRRRRSTSSRSIAESSIAATFCRARWLLGAERSGYALAPSRNAQRACINLASDFEFQGAIAQLGERSAGSRKVGGSSPPSSTPTRTEVGCHQFRNHFGFYLERAAAGDIIEVSRRGRPYARLVPVEATP